MIPSHNEEDTLASADSHHSRNAGADEPLVFPQASARRLVTLLGMTAVVGLVVALVFSFVFGSGIGGFRGGLRRFFLGYVTAYGFALTIALGALCFVMLQHVFRAGWSVAVRRVPEALANTMPALAVLSIPILLTLLFPGTSGNPTLYPWAVPHLDNQHGEATAGAATPSAEHAGAPEAAAVTPGITPAGVTSEPLLTREALTAGVARTHLELDELTLKKKAWLNRPFFALRIVIYFAVWIAIAGFYWRNSVLQDATGDPALTTKMQKWAPLAIIAFAFALSGAAFDLIMSLDPHFFSTIWGIYIFAGGMIGALAVIILVYQLLRMAGHLRISVGREHFHDLGKLLFVFVFFWGYIAFSQFMLIWYANIPETTYWFGVRGATTVNANFGFGAWPANTPEGDAMAAPVGWWSVVSMTLVFGHLLIPFAGLLSRHAKRNLTALGFWCGWMLVMHYIDLYWLIMPEAMVGGWRQIPLPEIGSLLAVVGAVGAYFVWALSTVNLRPAADPRLHESLAFHNI